MKTQRPKILIPSDWDGETWECFQVQWPKSDEWLAVLRGLLTLPMRGRNWDEESGSIRDVQQVGFEIEAQNIPLTTCDGEEVPSDGSTITEETIRYIYAGDGEGEIDMSWVCGVNPEAFKIEDGVLYVRSFCGEWVEIGSLTSPTDVSPADVWGDIDPPPDYYGCGKVSSLIDYMVALSTALWENYADPPVLEAAARAAVPPATLSRARIYQWISTLILYDESGLNQSMFENTTAIQVAKCYAAAIAEDTATGTVDEKEAVEEGMATGFYNLIGVLPKAQWKAYWHLIQETIGDQDCLLLLSLGATDDEADCECLSSVQASDIYFDGTYGLGTGTYFDIQSIEAVDGGRRVLVTGQVYSSGSFREANDAWAGLAGGAAGDSITFRVYPSVAGNPVPCEDWTLEDPPRPSDEWYEMELPDEQGHYTLTHVDESGYREYEFAMDDAGGARASKVQTYNMRIAPQDAAVGGEYRIWYIEIVKTVVDGLTKEYIPIGP